MNLDLLQKAANQARGLAMDAVHDCASGHLGLPLGCAEIGAVLFGDLLNICPSQPRWLNRDRFILSAGHGSMFLYGWLHLSGFNIGIEDIKNFRRKGSITPGHPEFRDTEGVECTTGPLGQGIANAVGFALSARRAAARFNRPGMDIFTQHVFCLTGDGCLQEGVARESLALAAVLKLDNLILIYDSNDITLDAPAERTQLTDPRAVYEALGWDVRQIDGHDIRAIESAVEAAKNAKNGKPQLIIAKTVIGKGIPGIEGTTKGHGEGGAKLQEEAHANWGIPAGRRPYRFRRPESPTGKRFQCLERHVRTMAPGLSGTGRGTGRRHQRLLLRRQSGRLRQGNTALPAGLWRCYPFGRSRCHQRHR